MGSVFLVTLLVDDYESAIDWYRRCLDFSVKEDTDMGGGKRWVVIGGRENGADILLAKAINDPQRAALGHQAGGRVGFFLRTGNFDQLYQRMNNAGVTFLEVLRDEPYGRVVQFADLYGNKWDLLEPR